jgi:hypothetical protein
MDDFNPQKIVIDLHTATQIAKGARRLIKEAFPLIKKLPWRPFLQGTKWLLKSGVEVMKESVRFPEPPRRTIFVVKFLATVASYLLVLWSALLVVADIGLFYEVQLPPVKEVAALALLAFMIWMTVAAFAQASWLRFLMAQNSRVLWNRRPPNAP